MGHRDFRLCLTAWGENCPQPAGCWTATSRRAHVRGELVSRWVRDPRYPLPEPTLKQLVPRGQTGRTSRPSAGKRPLGRSQCVCSGLPHRRRVLHPRPPPPGRAGSGSPPQVWPPAVLGDRPFAFDFVGRFQNIPPSEISRECTTLHIVIQSRMSTRLILSILKVTQQRTRRPGCESHEATLLAHYRCNNRQDDQRRDRSGAL